MNIKKDVDSILNLWIFYAVKIIVSVLILDMRLDAMINFDPREPTDIQNYRAFTRGCSAPSSAESVTIEDIKACHENAYNKESRELKHPE